MASFLAAIMSSTSAPLPENAVFVSNKVRLVEAFAAAAAGIVVVVVDVDIGT